MFLRVLVKALPGVLQRFNGALLKDSEYVMRDNNTTTFNHQYSGFGYHSGALPHSVKAPFGPIHNLAPVELTSQYGTLPHMQGLENAVEAFEGAIERETYHHHHNPSQGNIIERTNVTAPAINGNLPPPSLPHSLDNYEHDRNMMYNPMRNKPDEGMIPIEVLDPTKVSGTVKRTLYHSWNKESGTPKLKELGVNSLHCQIRA